MLTAGGLHNKEEVIRMARKTQMKLDVMSITVLLVMAIFGGLIGFYVGQAAGINAAIAAVGIR